MNNNNILNFFHHIHHKKNEHEVHHCGGKHSRIDEKVNYTIEHCRCKQHRINMKKAIGHDFDNNETIIEFDERCPQGGWHVESGEIKLKDIQRRGLWQNDTEQERDSDYYSKFWLFSRF